MEIGLLACNLDPLEPMQYVTHRPLCLPVCSNMAQQAMVGTTATGFDNHQKLERLATRSLDDRTASGPQMAD
ncbi:hypothetical protein ACFQAT_22715 [Undibacterium arcticum]|uniref:hypothetical protein n=1 Tax=Undibacterium arcticum TaxID=1762892 RepID=UPI003617D7DE